MTNSLNFSNPASSPAVVGLGHARAAAQGDFFEWRRSSEGRGPRPTTWWLGDLIWAIMPGGMEPENFLTHRHGWFGCNLADGVDPTAPPIPLPPGALGGTVPSPAPVPIVLPTLPVQTQAIPAIVTYLTLAIAYFALGVAVGALVRRLGRVQTVVLVVLVVPGVLAGLGLLAWILYSLRA